MNERRTKLYKAVARSRALIFEVERTIWAHPETGFREWETHRYLAEIFQKLGYSLTTAGEIPGFYTEFDTGRPGPKVLVMAELDGLLAPDHPEAVDGKAHACGHNAQCAALVGVAAALREEGVADGLSGSVRLMLVPGEELIELEYRERLRREGKIRYLTGKQEFLSRGMMDGCDLAFLFHGMATGKYDFCCTGGCNGCMTKNVTYRGRASHAGAAPEKGINALYAASLGLQAINSLRETFREKDRVRVHPIITNGGESVNIIPAAVTMESYVRAASMDAIVKTNRRVNRALAGTAAAMGAAVSVSDRPGYSPMHCDLNMSRLAVDCARDLFGEKRVLFDPTMWSTGSTDVGDVSMVMPALHPTVGGQSGHQHGADFCVSDPEVSCVGSAQCQLMLLDALLENDAAEAKRVVFEAKPPYPSIPAFLEALDAMIADRELVRERREDGVTELSD